jgi:hypothetical protein
LCYRPTSVSLSLKALLRPCYIITTNLETYIFLISRSLSLPSSFFAFWYSVRGFNHFSITRVPNVSVPYQSNRTLKTGLRPLCQLGVLNLYGMHPVVYQYHILSFISVKHIVVFDGNKAQYMILVFLFHAKTVHNEMENMINKKFNIFT